MNEQVSRKKERMKSMITVLAPITETFTSLTTTYILVNNSPFQVIYTIILSLYDIKKRMSHACHVTQQTYQQTAGKTKQDTVKLRAAGRSH